MKSLAQQINAAIDTHVHYTVDDDGLHGVPAATTAILDVVTQASRTALTNAQDEIRQTDGHHDLMHTLQTRVVLTPESSAPTPPTDTVEAVARAIARAQDADYWVDEIAHWETLEDWEREAHPEEHPTSAYEERENFRTAALAALGVPREDLIERILAEKLADTRYDTQRAFNNAMEWATQVIREQYPEAAA